MCVCILSLCGVCFSCFFLVFYFSLFVFFLSPYLFGIFVLLAFLREKEGVELVGEELGGDERGDTDQNILYKNNFIFDKNKVKEFISWRKNKENTPMCAHKHTHMHDTWANIHTQT